MELTEYADKVEKVVKQWTVGILTRQEFEDYLLELHIELAQAVEVAV